MYNFFKAESYREHYNDTVNIYDITIEMTNFEIGPYISDIYFYSPKFDKKFTLFQFRVENMYYIGLAEVCEPSETSKTTRTTFKWINCVSGHMSDFTKRIIDEPVDRNYSCEKIDPNKFMSVLLDFDLAPEYLMQSFTLALKASVRASNLCMSFAHNMYNIDKRLRHLINKNYEIETQLKKPDADTDALKEKQSEILKKITDLNNSFAAATETITKIIEDMNKVYHDVDDAYDDSYD